MHVNVAFRGMNGRALVRLASVSEGRNATPLNDLPMTRSRDVSSTFEVVLRWKEKRDRGREEIFRYLGRLTGALNRDESDHQRLFGTRGAKGGHENL